MEDFQSDYPLTYISLFSGIGGFEVGIHSIYPNARCLGYSEIDPHALQVYEKHFPDHPALGDVREIDGRKFRGKVDLLVGGSPCQNFSFLGDRKGLKGKKSNLFLEYCRLLQEIKPRHFILENVRMKQQHQDMISDILGCKPVLIDSNIVSFQRRKRLYWTDIDISAIQKMPLTRGRLGSILLDPYDQRLGEILWKNVSRPVKNTEIVLNWYSRGKTHEREKYFMIVTYDSPRTGTLITHGERWIFMDKYICRNFHPIELERLQTFPDNWTRGVPTTTRSGLCGNAVTCDVIALIVSMLDE